MENRLDRVFELCLLLGTVIAASELQYASSISPQDKTQINGVFRWTTIPMLILVATWIVLMLLPSISIKFYGLEKYVNKRVGKEFCWCLFGNLFILETITFVALSFSRNVTATALTGQWGTLLMFFLTAYPTWKYRKEDIYEMQRPSRKLKLIFVGEHLYLYALAYLIIYIILGYSIILPTP